MPDSIRRAIDLPTVDHRSPAFAASLPQLFGGLKQIVGTASGNIFFLTEPRWKDDFKHAVSWRSCAASSWVFSDKWIRLCQNFGLIVDVIDCDWRGPADPGQIEAILRADTGRQIKAVLATHNETATGVRSDLASIREAIDHSGSDALFVDGVSSIASMDFQMDEWD